MAGGADSSRLRRRWAMTAEPEGQEHSLDRRSMLIQSLLPLVLAGVSRPASAVAATAPETTPSMGKVTKTGLKYFDFREGDGAEPQFGQLVSIKYVLYGRPGGGRDGQLVKIDSSDDNGEPYLIKHGNGRQIKGLEEGLHTMRVGGRRRILVPAALGYTVPGLGPFPASPWSRRLLNKVLEALGTDGELVMDVDLLSAADDEADQGYYSDASLTLDELADVIRVTDILGGQAGQFEALPGQNPAEVMSGVDGAPKMPK